MGRSAMRVGTRRPFEPIPSVVGINVDSCRRCPIWELVRAKSELAETQSRLRRAQKSIAACQSGKAKKPHVLSYWQTKVASLEEKACWLEEYVSQQEKKVKRFLGL